MPLSAIGRPSAAVASALNNPRNPERITHEMSDLVAQRLYGLCCGYEDLNDHDRLRHDPLMQMAVGRTDELGSSPTFSCLATLLEAVLFSGVMDATAEPADRSATAALAGGCRLSLLMIRSDYDCHRNTPTIETIRQ